MNTPFEEYDETKGTREDYQQLLKVEEYLRYFEETIGHNDKLVLRTRLLWEEGLFCTVCKRKVLHLTYEIDVRQCEACNEKTRDAM